MSTRKRILFAIDEFGPLAEGGANVVVQNLIQELKTSNEVAILTTHRTGKEVIKKQVDGYTLYSIKVVYPLRLRSFLSLCNPLINGQLNHVLDDYLPDIFHAHTIHTYLTYYSLLIAYRRGIKTIFTGHDVMPVFYGRLTQFLDSNNDGIKDTLDYSFHFWKEWWRNKLEFNPFRNLAIRYILNQITVYTVSKALQRVFEANGVHVDQVVHNKIPTRMPDKKRVNEIKKRYQLNSLTFLMAGRIREDKGSFLGIEILQHFQSATLLLIGKQDNEARRMMELATVKGVEDRIVVLQNIPNSEMKNFYAASDIILVLSRCFDSYPTVVIEGLAAERPVMASQFGGAKESIDSYKYGYVVNPFDSRELMKTITEIQRSDFFSSHSKKIA